MSLLFLHPYSYNITYKGSVLTSTPHKQLHLPVYSAGTKAQYSPRPPPHYTDNYTCLHTLQIQRLSTHLDLLHTTQTTTLACILCRYKGSVLTSTSSTLHRQLHLPVYSAGTKAQYSPPPPPHHTDNYTCLYTLQVQRLSTHLHTTQTTTLACTLCRYKGSVLTSTSSTPASYHIGNLTGGRSL